jgi:hypothetical protein
VSDDRHGERPTTSPFDHVPPTWATSRRGSPRIWSPDRTLGRLLVEDVTLDPNDPHDTHNVIDKLSGRHHGTAKNYTVIPVGGSDRSRWENVPKGRRWSASACATGHELEEQE